MKWMAPLVALALSGCGPGQRTIWTESPTLVIRAPRLFDGRDLLAGRTVLVRDHRILGVVDESVEGQFTVPEGCDLIECDGCTILPGLIDAHVHLAMERELQQALAFGVTTELDLYTFLPADSREGLRRKIAEGRRHDLADFRMATTPVTVPGGAGVFFNPDIPTLPDAAGAQAFVDARLAEGADYIKIMYEDAYVYGREVPNLTPEMLSAAVEAAHARGKLAVAHVSSLHGARAAVDAGADGFAHVFADELPDESLADDAARQGMFLAATLATIQGSFEGPSGADLAQEERFHPYLHPEAIENLAAERRMTGAELGSFDNALETVRLLHEAGVSVLAGTDVPNSGTAHGISLHRELELLVRAGLTPVEALAAATSRPAEAFGLDDRGRVAPGLLADLLVVRGDPTTEVSATFEIVAVVHRGRPVDREALGEAIRAGASGE